VLQPKGIHISTYAYEYGENRWPKKALEVHLICTYSIYWLDELFSAKYLLPTTRLIPDVKKYPQE
jgi:hypothetical protein